MIVRLCGGQRQLNSDRVGRLRFFGPTSSLHLTESVTSSVLIQESNGKRSKFQWQDDFPIETQNYLLELFWTYQHHVVNKEGMAGAPSNNSLALTHSCSLPSRSGKRRHEILFQIIALLHFYSSSGYLRSTSSTSLGSHR